MLWGLQEIGVSHPRVDIPWVRLGALHVSELGSRRGVALPRFVTPGDGSAIVTGVAPVPSANSVVVHGVGVVIVRVALTCGDSLGGLRGLISTPTTGMVRKALR